MNINIPYFLTNKEWYTEEEVPLKDFLNREFEERIYQLTEKAPKEAIESYNEYYSTKVDEQTKKDLKEEPKKKNLEEISI